MKTKKLKELELKRSPENKKEREENEKKGFLFCKFSLYVGEKRVDNFKFRGLN